MDRPHHISACLIIAALGAGCGPSVRADDDPDQGDDTTTPDAYVGPLATITGTVWMPSYSPSLVPPGTDPIPVFDAAVYLSSVRPPPIPQEVHCEPCVEGPAGTQYSRHDGSFELAAVPGTYWLVIQKGQWRLEQPITIGAGHLELPDTQTTLPRDHDPDAGLWIPKVAIVLGTNDKIEDVLAKVGFDRLDGNKFVDVPGSEVTVFRQDTGARELIGDLDRLRQFHIVFFPCNIAVDEYEVPELGDQTALANLRRYVNEGGKLYVTDWSGEAMDRPFPPQITLGDLGADSMGTYDPIGFGGTLTARGTADGRDYTSEDAEVVDDDLDTWLGLQVAPSPGDPTPTPIDPDRLVIDGNWNWIAALDDTVQTGVDAEGLPIYDVPKTWVIGSRPFSDGAKRPLTVTFEPTGCGRVLYSTYHTADFDHVGLHPQERVLLFLIAEIGVCSEAPVVD